MSKIFIWLDDERRVPDWTEKFDKIIICQTYRQAIRELNTIIFEPKEEEIYISFDHDLGGSYTGYDVAKYIVNNNMGIDGFEVHSMNPVGKKNIEQLMTYYGYQLGIKI